MKSVNSTKSSTNKISVKFSPAGDQYTEIGLHNTDTRRWSDRNNITSFGGKQRGLFVGSAQKCGNVIFKPSKILGGDSYSVRRGQMAIKDHRNGRSTQEKITYCLMGLEY